MTDGLFLCKRLVGAEAHSLWLVVLFHYKAGTGEEHDRSHVCS